MHLDSATSNLRLHCTTNSGPLLVRNIILIRDVDSQVKTIEATTRKRPLLTFGKRTHRRFRSSQEEVSRPCLKVSPRQKQRWRGHKDIHSNKQGLWVSGEGVKQAALCDSYKGHGWRKGKNWEDGSREKDTHLKLEEKGGRKSSTERRSGCRVEKAERVLLAHGKVIRRQVKLEERNTKSDESQTVLWKTEFDRGEMGKRAILHLFYSWGLLQWLWRGD